MENNGQFSTKHLIFVYNSLSIFTVRLPTKPITKESTTMVLQILLITSIVLQLVAAGIAISLMSRTKYNLSWILFTVALVAMAVVRCTEYIQLVWDTQIKVPQYFFVWLGVITSLCFAVGVFLMHQIFNWIDRLEFQRQLTGKRILNTVLRTEEKERMHFSKELHDGLGPLLSSAKMSLSAIKQDNLSEGDQEIFENTRYVIDQAIISLREISNNLSPHILNDFGLARGVRNFINRLPTKGDFIINYRTNLRSERFNTDIEVILYRIICELINNSLKHSGGSEINLNLHYSALEKSITIDYSDNGIGFNPETMMDMGMGLSNIVSRVSSLKGKSEIISSRGNGMQTYIEVSTDTDERKRRRESKRRRRG